MRMNDGRLAEIVRQLLTEFGDDVDREGLKDTPTRVAKAYAEILSGYDRSLKEEMTVFKNTHHYDDIVYSGSIHFFSICEHHLLPFYGVAHVAYIPDKQLIGLSKLARTVDIFSRRLQDQERITMQVAGELDDLLHPKGVAVMLKGQHLCNMARGVKQFDSNMTTMTFKGVFKDNQAFCDRFIAMASSAATK